eukprot:m.292901 g.292901  ORF g.292901 m.292901 type:complete len:97 (+) comp40732_c1_seq32:49-339(+)
MHSPGSGKRKRTPSSTNMDEEAKLMRSRVSARDCRARKKQRYQKLELLVQDKEKTIFKLRKELQQLYEECASQDQASQGGGTHTASGLLVVAWSDE